MYKEIKEKWIPAIAGIERVSLARYEGWHTNLAMVALVKILIEEFGEPLDFDPKKRTKDMMRHPDFDLIHELSGISRLDPYIPSFMEYLDKMWAGKDPQTRPRPNNGKVFTLSEACQYNITGVNLAKILEKDIEIATEPIDISQFYHIIPPKKSKKEREFVPNEKAPEKIPPPSQPAPIDDLPF